MGSYVLCEINLGVNLGSVAAEPMCYEGLCVMRGMCYERFDL